MFLKFSHKVGGTGVEDHHDAIVDANTQEERNSDIGDDDCSVINVENKNFPTPEHIEADGSDAFSAKYEKEKQVHIDVDDFPVEIDVSNAVSETQNKQIPHSEKHLNMKLFENVEPEVINKMPWNPNGNKIYTINCKEEYWHKGQHDGKFWLFSPSSRKGLVGVCKFGKCLGSFICLNDECPAYTTEGICNEIDFKKERNGPHICKSCGYFVQRKACEALKVTEFDHHKEVLTIWHQGSHSCVSKPDVEAQEKALDRAQSQILPIEFNICNTTREFQIDLVGYYVSTGQVKKTLEIAEDLADRSLIERIHYGDKDSVL